MDGGPVALAAATIADIDRESVRWQAHDCHRITIQDDSAHLRTVFRFAEHRA